MLKILAIGNSFSVDALKYAYQIAKSLGHESVTIGNLYIGGCSLNQHLHNTKNDLPAYDYFLNTTGKFKRLRNYKISTAIASDNWDIITLQQCSNYSGIESTYCDVAPLIEQIHPLLKSAKLAWHATWSYQKNSSHPAFYYYNKNQGKMYEAITTCVKNKILSNKEFTTLIPNCTAIQNARNTSLGDTLTRDGYHLSLDVGRYVAGLCFIGSITGMNISNIQYTPKGVNKKVKQICIESAKCAIANPLSVTKIKL